MPPTIMASCATSTATWLAPTGALGISKVPRSNRFE